MPIKRLVRKQLDKKRIKRDEAVINEPVCYYCINEKVMSISMGAGQAPALPLQLIVPPGKYMVHGKTVNFENEGLYRVMAPILKNYQVIVYKNSLDTLISSVAWIVSHGNSNNTWSYEKLCDVAMSNKIYLTCNYISLFFKKMLTDLDYKARMVSAFTLNKHNNYNSSHVMLEVFHPQLNKWILTDVDNKCLFLNEEGQYLNLPEFREALYADKLQIKKISNSVHTDISGFKHKNNYSWGFLMEMLQGEGALKRWYKDVMDIIFVEDHFFDTAKMEAVKKHSSKYTYLEPATFFEKFYN